MTSNFDNYLSKDPAMVMWASFIVVCTMCLHAFGVVITKKLQNVNGIQINYHLGLLCLFEVGPIAVFGFNDPSYNSPTMQEFLICMILGGIPMAIGSTFYIIALKLTSNYGMLTPFMFTSIIFGYLMSIFRYG